ncbi:MAG: hypothetical protein IPO62_12975 [Saprospiraceae bacterium]|nr:hypothetical protein [Saprospiraceae bacterium]
MKPGKSSIRLLNQRFYTWCSALKTRPVLPFGPFIEKRVGRRQGLLIYNPEEAP